MIDGFPRVTSVVLAEALETLPTRLRKKIDMAAAPDTTDPGMVSADGSNFVLRQGTGVVTFKGSLIESIAQVQCDCLLSPRCLHLTQALLRCEVADVTSTTVTGSNNDSVLVPGVDTASEADQAVSLTDQQAQVIERALAPMPFG